MESIKKLLKQSPGISKQSKKQNFSEFSGIWSQEELDKFEHSIKDFEKIDRHFLKIPQARVWDQIKAPD